MMESKPASADFMGESMENTNGLENKGLDRNPAGLAGKRPWAAPVLIRLAGKDTEKNHFSLIELTLFTLHFGPS